MTAQNVTLGNFKLNQSQIERLGKTEEKSWWYLKAKAAIAGSEEVMSGYGFKPFVLRGEYLMSSTSISGHAEEHIGQYRVRFHYNTCGIASVMAQQV